MITLNEKAKVRGYMQSSPFCNLLYRIIDVSSSSEEWVLNLSGIQDKRLNNIDWSTLDYRDEGDHRFMDTYNIINFIYEFYTESIFTILSSDMKYFYLRTCIELNIRLYSVKGCMTMAFHDDIVGQPGSEVHNLYMSDLPVNVIIIRRLDKLGITAKAVEESDLKDCIKFSFDGCSCYAVTNSELLKVIKSYESIVDNMIKDGNFIIDLE